MNALRSAVTSGSSDLIVPGEFALRAGDFRRIASMIYDDAGIYLSESKATLVYARLAKRLRALMLESFGEYCDLVASPQGRNERYEMLAALTTNVTSFFREGHHFEHLKQCVLPKLLDGARKGGSVRFWSAACSSGQEPYSIALTILPLMPDAASYDVKILATDIDPHIVAKAREGQYNSDALENVPIEARRKYFSRASGSESLWNISSEVKQLVAFKELNLTRDWPIKKQFDGIFCRNVVIYFDESTQQRIWSRFLPKLRPGGWLYIGHSERVSGPAASELRSDGITSYQLKRGAEQ